MIYAAILAGGVGKRIERTNTPKQFISIANEPIIIRTIRTFLAVNQFEKIYVAVHPEWTEYANNLFKSFFSNDEYNRLKIVPGGKERIDSFLNVSNDIVTTSGLNEEDILICHDSVRPFVRRQMIDDCIEETLKFGLAQTCVPVADTIFLSKEESFITDTLDRKLLYSGQTPTGFNLKLLKETCDGFSDEEKASITGTTQLFLKIGKKLKIVKGHTSNFKITTDNDLDVAERMLRTSERNRNVEILDCTLRDGGIVIGFNFGSERMQSIKESLEASGVEYIECGYIDEKKGEAKNKTCFDSEVSIEKNFLYSGKKPGVTYLAMIDYGTFDCNKLGQRTADGIDGIRLAFHKEKWHEAISVGKIIISKGYDLFIQPMVSMRYSDEEYRELISVCNKELPQAKGFYIVDSFGQMDNMAVTHKLSIADKYASSSMKLGFHAHNNRQMAFSNACAFANHPTKHSLMLDSSIMGMGKGAGNLCSELMAPILIEDGKKYNTLPFYEQISDYFVEQLKITPWGYSLDYYLSSLYSCTPSYINIFKKDERVNTEHLINLVKNIPAEKRAACDREFAAKYLKEYFEGVK